MDVSCALNLPSCMTYLQLCTNMSSYNPGYMMMMMVMMMISMEFHYLLFSYKTVFFNMYLHSFKVMNNAHAVVDKNS